MPYDVIANHRKGYAGFRRSGRFFSSATSTRVSDRAMTDAILNEPHLTVRKVIENTPIRPVQRTGSKRN